MRTLVRRLVVLLAMVCPAVPAGAQAVEPAGHWEGAVTGPFGEIQVEVDLAKDAKGAWTGVFGQPAQGLRGLPLASVSVDGAAVRFAVGAGAGATTFAGTIGSDSTLSGNASSAAGTVPFRLKRTGEAVIEAPPQSAPVSKALEGRWNGTLAANGQQLRLLLKIANQADGATASLVSVDQGGVEMPAVVTEKGADVSWEVKGTRASFVGKVNAAGDEIAGTFTQGPASLPLTFRRAAE